MTWRPSCEQVWRSENLTVADRLVMLYMISALACPHGEYWFLSDTDGQIAYACGLSSAEVEKILADLVDVGWIYRRVITEPDDPRKGHKAWAFAEYRGTYEL